MIGYLLKIGYFKSKVPCVLEDQAIIQDDLGLKQLMFSHMFETSRQHNDLGSFHGLSEKVTSNLFLLVESQFLKVPV